MIKSLHFSRALDRQLDALQRAGKKGEKAIQHYERICEILRSEGVEAEELFAKRTKKGEYRLKYCVKYDLGSGYRLITVRLGDRLYLPFVGNHDEADQWLDRQKCDEFDPVVSVYLEEILNRPAEIDDDGAENMVGREPELDPYEEQLVDRLDEELLKSMFHGLFQKQKIH
jgi:hypothetical protein